MRAMQIQRLYGFRYFFWIGIARTILVTENKSIVVFLLCEDVWNDTCVCASTKFKPNKLWSVITASSSLQSWLLLWFSTGLSKQMALFIRVFLKLTVRLNWNCSLLFCTRKYRNDVINEILIFCRYLLRFFLWNEWNSLLFLRLVVIWISFIVYTKYLICCRKCLWSDS